MIDFNNDTAFRTYVEILIKSGREDLAGIVIDGQMEIWTQSGCANYVQLKIPVPYYITLELDQTIKDDLIRFVHILMVGRAKNDMSVDCMPELIEPDEDWQNIVKELIVRSKDPNQGVITEIVRRKNSEKPIKYNEMKFGSVTEIKIAKELEKRKILFFPLPLAIRADTGNSFKDHREPDFLICYEGVWGILEVAYHPYRYEQDKEKDQWFKRSGILCIEHCSSEEAYKKTSEVIDTFLSILTQHRK